MIGHDSKFIIYKWIWRAYDLGLHKKLDASSLQKDEHVNNTSNIKQQKNT